MLLRAIGYFLEIRVNQLEARAADFGEVAAVAVVAANKLTVCRSATGRRLGGFRLGGFRIVGLRVVRVVGLRVVRVVGLRVVRVFYCC